MSAPQSGIFAEGNRSHWFVEIDLDEPSRAAQALADVQEAAAGSTPNDTAQMVVGFGPALAASVLGPACEVPAFPDLAGSAGRWPATQRDLFIWVHSDQHDRNFEVVTAIRRAFADIGTIVADVSAWVYRDSRDLTGFIDGTENPEAEAARQLVLQDAGPTAGSTFAITQRWVHDLDRFHALGEAEQEQIIGRTKADSIELTDVPETSHVGRVVIEDADGDELEIYRRSVPYGNTVEAGLYFLAFTGDLGIIDEMLHSMIGADGEATGSGVSHDRLTDFSSPVTGSYWFIPSMDQLAALG